MQKIELTKQQQECVNFPVRRDLIVQGVAGSGKSLVIASRAASLSELARQTGHTAKIVIFTYVNTLVHYTQEILSEQSEIAQDVKVTTLDKEIIALYQEVFGRRRFQNLYDRHMEILDQVLSSGNFLEQAADKGIFSSDSREFLLDEICWMKQHMMTDPDQYLECVRKGRGMRRIRRKDRGLVFQIYETFYKTLKDKQLKTIDILCEELYRAKERIRESSKYDFVLIDEAQDLPLNKLLIACEIAKISVTISADFAQKIYKTGFTWKEIGLEVRNGGSKKLTGTFRNTREIAELANSIIRENTELKDEDITQPVLPDRQGKPPRIYSASIETQKKKVCDIIKKSLLSTPSLTIGILGRDRRSMTTIEGWLKEGGISFAHIDNKSQASILEPGVKTVTYHSAKGLEFDVVILPMVDAGYFPYTKGQVKLSDDDMDDLMNEARKLLYVGITRAKSMLYIFFDGYSPLLSRFKHKRIEDA